MAITKVVGAGGLEPDGVTLEEVDGTIRVKDRGITRAKLEYPTTNITFNYLITIAKAVWGIEIGRSEDNALTSGIKTVDNFTDKYIEGFVNADFSSFFARAIDKDNLYGIGIDSSRTTKDPLVHKVVDGTQTILASEGIDIDIGKSQILKLNIAGSSLTFYRNNSQIGTITDTEFTTGYWGYGTEINIDYANLPAVVYFGDATSRLQKPIAIVELPVIEENKRVEVQLPQDLRDPKKLGLNLNKPQINLKSVTYGAIDYKGGSTMIIAIYKHGAPYLDPKRFEDVLAIAKNKWKVPNSVQEAEEIWKEFKNANPDMIAGKHTVAYHIIGDANIEPCSVADFYHGNLIQEQKIKGVPEWELRRTLLRWKDKLEKARLNAELKEKHMKKLEECLRR